MSNRSIDISLSTLADRARDRGEWTRAAALYNRAAQASPREPGIWMQLGHAFKEIGLATRAEVAYRQALLLAPLDDDIRLQIGHLLKICGDRAGAIKAYREALALNSANVDALRELIALDGRKPLAGEINFDKPPLLIDVGDLARYAERFKRPTGIQRVQLAVIGALLTDETLGRPLAFVIHDDESWHQVSSLELRDLQERLQTSAIDDTDWPTPATEARRLAPVTWPSNATFLMLGTAWDDPKHTDSMCALKRDFNIRISTFIHDLVPADRPDLCVPGLSYRFEGWLIKAIQVTDSWISNSEFTAARLRAFAEKQGLPIPVVAVAQLGAALPRRFDLATQASGRTEAQQAVGFDLAKQRFVIAVGTIEPRKNYETLIAAWRLVSQTDSTAPTLAIVGKVGWNALPVMRAVAQAQNSGVPICHVTGLSDQALDALYAAAAFTVYPSIMEGWGLPVTESLAHGKIVVAGRHSGVAEAAAQFGYYADVTSPNALAEGLSQLLSKPKVLADAELKIKQQYKLRSWSEVARDVVAAADLGELISTKIDAR